MKIDREPFCFRDLTQLYSVVSTRGRGSIFLVRFGNHHETMLIPVIHTLEASNSMGCVRFSVRSARNPFAITFNSDGNVFALFPLDSFIYQKGVVYEGSKELHSELLFVSRWCSFVRLSTNPLHNALELFPALIGSTRSKHRQAEWEIA